MRAFVLVASLVVAATAIPVENTKNGLPVVYGYAQGEKCPAQEFYDDCNYCSCMADGHHACCVLMAYPSTRQTYDDLPHIDYFHEVGQCKPGQMFYDRCNVCSCNKDGSSAACTPMACPPVDRHIDGYRHGDKCPAGKTFYDGCNACICSEDGLSAACTSMKCPSSSRTRRSVSDESNVPHIDNFDQIQQCKPGQIFYDACNTCKCNADGKSAACTLAACPAVEESHIDGYKHGNKCIAGQFFKDDCNSCVCGDDGVSAACTFMACPSSNDEIEGLTKIERHIDNFDEIRQCSPGKTFYDNCNSCTCNADGESARCTLLACPPLEKIHIDGYRFENKCPAGKAFFDRCNSCFCGRDGGSAICTRMACPEYE